MRRTLVIAVVAIPCGLVASCVIAFLTFGPGYKWKTDSFLKEIRATTTVEQVRSWALEEIVLADGAEAELKAPPILLKTSDGRPSWVKAYPAQGSEEPQVHVVWGGGFGHWGLVIGSPAFRPEQDRRNYYIEWEPGVYAWHEIQ